RPPAVLFWSKRGKPKALVPTSELGDLGRFKDDWHAWYLGLMPAWRSAGMVGPVAWPLSRAVPDGEQWTDIRKGGRSGIFTVLVTLFWW
ncbi:hypothetical protein SCHPADRAFT_792897, partial [Schizopora paradoxa]